MNLQELNHADPRTIFWNVVGFTGQLIFFSRFIVQWYVTEKKKRIVVPITFWYLSIAGALVLFVYGICYDKHWVVICGYAFSWIPYIRNLIIHYRHKDAHLNCPQCGKSCSPESKFCSECGTQLAAPR